MKVLNLLGAVIFATCVVAGSPRANGQDKNRVEKRERWDMDRINSLACDMNGTVVSDKRRHCKD
ncbi:hypothetical protein N7447_008220 [Penicillium robsamsonii]|uniref:uncharacterized protein n=1 Tax=Penicillium robsamsonii TaxID=1792511 RepID=UPI0025476C79|nr:uncharacterized protein N7447_008220 [Penicillium robsamsonii]KAJ5815987.1 hypothetical protein N7447_008220 [Penicillium robsamsonii]